MWRLVKRLLAAAICCSLCSGSFAQSRTIDFAGYRWHVKSSEGVGPMGPGPNWFDGTAQSVWVDARGHLHLRLAWRAGRWSAAEVWLARPLGYGTYRFSLASPVHELDANVVLGLFTWSDAANDNHREIDIEFARWGHAAEPTSAQFVVQPHERPGNLHRFAGCAHPVEAPYSFTWQPGRVDFASDCARWSREGSAVPGAGDERVHINLWLFEGRAPRDGQAVEVVVSSFEFDPLARPVARR